jgi:hypothetical protein
MTDLISCRGEIYDVLTKEDAQAYLRKHDLLVCLPSKTGEHVEFSLPGQEERFVLRRSYVELYVILKFESLEGMSKYMEPELETVNLK